MLYKRKKKQIKLTSTHHMELKGADYKSLNIPNISDYPDRGPL